MASYGSSAGVQLGRLESEIRAYLDRALKAGGKQIRKDVVRDRFSKPRRGPGIGLARKTGKAARSVEYAVYKSGPSKIQLEVSAGRRRAWYVEVHEEAGRLGFVDYVKRKYRDLQDAIQTGLQFLVKNPAFLAGVTASTASGDVTGLGDEAREAVLSRHFGARTDFRGLGLRSTRPRRRRRGRAAV
jgi:hypothetical protein